MEEWGDLIAAAVLELVVLSTWVVAMSRVRFEFRSEAEPERVLRPRQVRDFVEPLREIGFEPLGVLVERAAWHRTRVAVYAHRDQGIFALLYSLSLDTGLQLLSAFEGGGLVFTQRGYFVRARREPDLIARGLTGRLGSEELLAEHRADRLALSGGGRTTLVDTSSAQLLERLERFERSSYERAKRRMMRLGTSALLATATFYVVWVLWDTLAR